MLTRETLEHVFSYDPLHGGFIRKIGTRSKRKGSRAGTPLGNHRCITVNGVRHKEHVLVWLWHTGIYSYRNFEHLNGDHTDNRIENLREISPHQQF